MGQQAIYTQWLRDGEDSLAKSVSAAAQRSIVLVDQPLARGGAALLRDLGARLFVMPPRIYDSLPDTLGTFTDTTQLVQVELSPGVTVDAAIIDRTMSQALSRVTTTPLLSAIESVADLLAARQQVEDLGGDPRRHSLTLSTPDLTLPATTGWAEFTKLLASTPGLRPTTMDEISVRTDELLGADGPVVVGLPDKVPGDIGARVALTTQLNDIASSTASMLPADDQRTVEWNRLIGVLPTSASTDPVANTIAASLRSEFDGLRAAVGVPAGFSFNLTGRTGTIPVNLHNSADIPLKVRLRMSSSKLVFPGGDKVVTLDPESFTHIQVPVDARTNGDFPVVLEVLPPTGNTRLGPAVLLTASITNLSGAGTLFTFAALLLLLAWWARHLRTHRPRAPCHRRRQPSPDHPHRARRRPGTLARRRNEYPPTLVSTERVRIVTDSRVRPASARRRRARHRDRPADHPHRRPRVRRPCGPHAAPSSGRSAPPRRRCPRRPRRRPVSSRPTYRKLAAEGATSIVAINLSAALSATMQSAELAARGVADVIPVTVVDSQQVHARPRRDRDATAPASPPAVPAIDDVVDRADRSRRPHQGVGRARHAGEPEEGRPHRRRRRRCSASVLSIKPIIEVRDGKVEEGGKQRTRSKALAFLVEKLIAAGPIENADGDPRRLQRRRRVRRRCCARTTGRDRRRRHRPGRRHPRRPRHHRHRICSARLNDDHDTPNTTTIRRTRHPGCPPRSSIRH